MNPGRRRWLATVLTAGRLISSAVVLLLWLESMLSFIGWARASRRHLHARTRL